MLYAPYLSEKNAQYKPGTDGLILSNPDNSILGDGKGPFGYIIVPASEAETATILEDGRDLLKRLAAYKPYFQADSTIGNGSGHHH
jgi:hypothetical protein